MDSILGGGTKIPTCHVAKKINKIKHVTNFFLKGEKKDPKHYSNVSSIYKITKEIFIVFLS